MPAHAHRLVASVAKAFASELYETVMSNNLVRAEWKRQHPGADERTLVRRFVTKNWGKCLAGARATLALQLRGPIDTAMKESIMEALVLDATLMRGRKRVGEGMQIVNEVPSTEK